MGAPGPVSQPGAQSTGWSCSFLPLHPFMSPWQTPAWSCAERKCPRASGPPGGGQEQVRRRWAGQGVPHAALLSCTRRVKAGEAGEKSRESEEGFGSQLATATRVLTRGVHVQENLTLFSLCEPQSPRVWKDTNSKGNRTVRSWKMRANNVQKSPGEYLKKHPPMAAASFHY